MLSAIAGNNGRHFGHNCCRRASKISKKNRGQQIYTNFYINLMNPLKPFDRGFRKICTRTPSPQVASIYPIHAARGVSGSNTMVMVFVRSFVLFVWFLTRDSSVVLIVCTFWRCSIVSHPGVHHTVGENHDHSSKTGFHLVWYTVLLDCAIV